MSLLLTFSLFYVLKSDKSLQDIFNTCDISLNDICDWQKDFTYLSINKIELPNDCQYSLGEWFVNFIVILKKQIDFKKRTSG